LQGIYNGTTLLLSALKRTLPTVIQKSWIYMQKYMVSVVAINLVVAGLLQVVHAGATASANSPKQCFQRDWRI
jgi:hypothetical protein